MEEDLDALLTRGGWELDDAQERHRANPDTFWLPSAEQLAALDRGDQVRLIFRLVSQAEHGVDEPDPYDDDGRPNLVILHERMWLHVVDRDGDRLTGVLYSVPWASHTSLTAGSTVVFDASDVIDFDEQAEEEMNEELQAMAEMGFPVQPPQAAFAAVDRDRLPELLEDQEALVARVGVRPERVSPLSRLVAGKALGDAASWPVYGVRSRPNPDHAFDCGWAIWSGEQDFEQVAADGGLEVAGLGTVLDRRPAVRAYLPLPVGWVFVLFEDGTDDVFFDQTVLDPSD